MAFAARRGEVCEEAAREAGGVAIGLSCDVTDEEQCTRVVVDTVAGLGGLDDVVYSTGAISIVALAEATTEWWRRTFETNVMGAALITKAALPHLQQSTGSVIYLSSVASIGPVWPGIGVYTATKAALNRMVETWRSEHPEIGFTRIFVGPTDESATGTEFDMSAVEHMARSACDGRAVRSHVHADVHLGGGRDGPEQLVTRVGRDRRAEGSPAALGVRRRWGPDLSGRSHPRSPTPSPSVATSRGTAFNARGTFSSEVDSPGGAPRAGLRRP